MKCPICLESDIISNCKVIFKYTEIKKQFEEKEREKKIRFTFVGYLIMDLLKKMQKALPLQKIGETLDYSTTTLQVHIRILIEQNMIAIDNEPTQTLKKGLSGNFWLVSFKISYLCLPLFYETRTTPSCHPSGCAYRQL